MPMQRCTSRLVTAAAVVLPALSLSGALLLAARGATSAPSRRPAPTPRRVAASPTNAAYSAAFAREVQPLIRTYCVPCHSVAVDPPGGVRLTESATFADALQHRDLWDRVVANLQTKHMPPVGMPQPTPAQRTQMIAMLQSGLSSATCSIQEPGRVTARRLNRAEYQNTIRDLLYIDLPGLTDDFPSDDVGYGFDNIGDVLSLSPLHLEKYLRAAGKAARAAITAPEDWKAKLRGIRLTGDQLVGDGSPLGLSGRELYTTGLAGTVYDFPAPGRYVIRATAWEQHAGPDVARMSFVLGDHVLRSVMVSATSADQAGVYEIPIDIDRAGRQAVRVGFLNDYYDPTNNDPKMRGDRNLIIEALAVRADGENAVPSTIKPSASEGLILRSRPTDSTERAKDAATRKDLAAFLLRAYRRPPAAEEIARLARLAATMRGRGASWERSMQVAVQAALVSPSFLFRIEKDPDGAAGQHERPLNDYELATRLSYFLWSSMPDDRLLQLAQEGKLHRTEILRQEAKRMLQDGRAAQSLGDNFAAQWLTLRILDRVTPDPNRFPQWNSALRDAMKNETLLYFRNIVQQDKSILEFLDSDYTFLNEPLARLYGNTTIQGADFQKVALHGGQRGGVLTQASVLTVTSNPTRTSPVKRGKWVLENLLGEAIPMPPPGVPQLPDDAQHAQLTGTLRERLEQHRKNPSCASCHQRMDPLGFGLENYNAIGMWRTREETGSSIDATGVLPSGTRFRGSSELRRVLVGMSPKFVHNFSEKLLTFALGRGMESSDRCNVDMIAASVSKRGYRFSSVVDGIVTSQPFRYRRGEPGNKLGTTPRVASSR